MACVICDGACHAKSVDISHGFDLFAVKWNLESGSLRLTKESNLGQSAQCKLNSDKILWIRCKKSETRCQTATRLESLLIFNV